MALPKFIKRKMRRALSRDGALIYDDRMQAGSFRKLVPEPDLLVDVGVANGTPWLYGAFPEKRFFLVDPMTECEAKVANLYPDLEFEFHGLALGEKQGTTELKIPLVGEQSHGSKASTLTRSDHFSPQISGWETRTVDVTMLDELTPKKGRFGLKIDTEGSEAPILRGAERTLSQCDFVVLELSLRKRFSEVAPPSYSIDILRKAGLELRDVLSLNGGTKDHSPNHMDCLFTRWN